MIEQDIFNIHEEQEKNKPVCSKAKPSLSAQHKEALQRKMTNGTRGDVRKLVNVRCTLVGTKSLLLADMFRSIRPTVFNGCQSV